ncbi:MAG: pyrroline-5-carboxylate reductase [Erysipelotrichaceae bacterium]|nr:pyrroline-5-carboxylate reductase [Erysipelotrichaceae bacterium]
MYKYGFIGLGNMASALITGFLEAADLNGTTDIIGYDINQAAITRQDGRIAIGQSNEDVIRQSDVVFVCVKPQVAAQVVLAVRDELKNKAIVSIVLGFDYDRYEELLDSSTRHLTIMPNLAVAVKQGVCLLEEKQSLTDEEFASVRQDLDCVGKTVILGSHLMGVGGAVSGCAPAYVYMVIEAMADGAVANGLPRADAYAIAAQTVAGAAMLQAETGTHPGILKDQVTSPAGSTIKGVMALEKGGMRSLFIDAINASLKK